ncbi:zeta toxin family protein [Vagococcus zengguangii]
MITIITGSTHAGKTALAQALLEREQTPYLSIDHLKMGLIRAGHTSLTPLSEDSELTAYLWPIVAEMIKTASENRQDLIVEGCYVPADWKSYFTTAYLNDIRFVCLILSESYIKQSFDQIVQQASVIEQRLDDEWLTPELLIQDNRQWLEDCQIHQLPYILIEEVYDQAMIIEQLIQQSDK